MAVSSRYEMIRFGSFSAVFVGPLIFPSHSEKTMSMMKWRTLTMSSMIFWFPPVPPRRTVSSYYSNEHDDAALMTGGVHWWTSLVVCCHWKAAYEIQNCAGMCCCCCCRRLLHLRIMPRVDYGPRYETRKTTSMSCFHCRRTDFFVAPYRGPWEIHSSDLLCILLSNTFSCFYGRTGLFYLPYAQCLFLQRYLFSLRWMMMVIFLYLDRAKVIWNEKWRDVVGPFRFYCW